MLSSEVSLAESIFNALPDSIMSVGRMGTYRYVDIDDIIMQGLEFEKIYNNNFIENLKSTYKIL